MHACQHQAIAAGGIVAVEPIRDRAVKQRDESNARIAKVNVACKTALGKLDLSELLRRESETAANTAQDDSCKSQVALHASEAVLRAAEAALRSSQALRHTR